MKLTVKRKVANGLVLGFLLPPAAAIVPEALDFDSGGLNAYAADDDFDIASTAESEPVAQVLVADPCDPSGVDPSGVNTMCFEPDGGLPILCVRAPSYLATAEDGTSDFFEIYGQPDPSDPSGTEIYRFESTDPGEAKPVTQAVALGADACEPRPIWVSGQDDGYPDGDRWFDVKVVSESGVIEATIPGINVDNDRVPDVYISVMGPSHLPQGGSGMFDAYVSYFGGDPMISGYDLEIGVTPGLSIVDYAVSGGSFKGKPRITPSGALLLQLVELQFDETMIVSMEIVLTDGGQAPESVVARMINRSNGDSNDNSTSVRTSLR